MLNITVSAIHNRSIVHYAQNPSGRDFVTGDLHGCFTLLDAALHSVGFDATRDRLFCVGDLTDRGPQSEQALAYLAQPWFHAILGNHEGMIVEAYEDSDTLHPATLTWFYRQNGRDWWEHLDQTRRLAIVKAFRQLPIGIEIDSRIGLVGLVHAEVPAQTSWEDFKRDVAAGRGESLDDALWGRQRGEDQSGVPGLARLYVGHTIKSSPMRYGNIYAIDTGGFKRFTHGSQTHGLTVVDITCDEACFKTPGGNRQASQEQRAH